MRRGVTRIERRIFVGAGLIAANLPDLDLLYSGITPAPLGYLLHHRGHTHTVPGLAALAVGLILSYRLLPPVRKLRLPDRLRLWMVIAIALASHILLDALNSYGVHPFYPTDVGWYYGDAVFIFEPWLWLVLGVTNAWNARGRVARFAAALPILVVPIAFAAAAIIPVESAASIVVGGALIAWTTTGMSARTRAGVALAMSVMIIGGFVAISRSAGSAAMDALQPHVRGRVVDVILTPDPSSPLCWSVIAIDLDEKGGQYILRSGTLSLAPRWKSATSCASHRFAAPLKARMIAGGHFVVRDEVHQSLARLRDLARTDCWVRAWLQFGRAPVITDDAIFDLRFSARVGQNFSHMPLKSGPGVVQCPPNLTNWGMPRADLLSR